MQLIGLKHLTKLKSKQPGNVKLIKAIDALINDLKKARWKSKDEVIKDRSDADCVHSDGYYFFDIHIHRTLALIEYEPADGDDEGIITIRWAGGHNEYERIFKNNKSVIEKWLRQRGLIE